LVSVGGSFPRTRESRIHGFCHDTSSDICYLISEVSLGIQRLPDPRINLPENRESDG